ncbi:hypothetical protein KL912_001790 [Ogataea haglerorum]|nr:hypothetical protein KL912_001790 [Ogataea haglerorum]
MLIGVDVGGTNTDSVLIDPTKINSDTHGVLAWNKMVTSAEVSDSIQKGISKLFEECKDVDRKDVASVTIGTTHFINAVVEQDRARLDKVAVLRLCGPYSRHVYPFSDFPDGLTAVIRGYIGYMNGGFHVDGNEIQPVNDEEVLEHVRKAKELGITSFAVIGIFSHMRPQQEELVKSIILKEIPHAKVSVSHQVSGIGYLERENATILNASILHFAEKIISSFANAIKKLGLNCPVFLTQNDGTILSAAEALSLPIRTFSSGATNSMRGASFLAKTHGKSAIVLDVGGTTTDVGLLLSTGFPRQSSSYSIVGGVKMNFSMPHVESIGLGGGSLVRGDGDTLTIGPDSTGSEIVKRALVFGGSEVTATDCAVAAELQDGGSLEIGAASLVKDKFSAEYLAAFKKRAKVMMEKAIDRMKTNPADITVLAVGGGSFIVPEHLDGASAVIRPPFYSVANAIGAAMGKVSAEISEIRLLPPGTSSKEEVLEQLKKKAVDKIVAKGGLEDTIETVFVSTDAVPYVPNTFEFVIKIVADVDYSKAPKLDVEEKGFGSGTRDIFKSSLYEETETRVEEEVDYTQYKPTINKDRQWVLSEVDLDFLAIGAYILGCGGGGNPYSYMLEVRNYLRAGDTVTVVDLEDAHKYIKGEGSIVGVCYAGSPTVSHEQMLGDALMESYDIMARYINKKPELLFPIEIGGGNGLCTFQISSSSRLNLPVVDCDTMGRAYPTHWQTTPVVYTPEGECFYAPMVFANGNGNSVILASSKSDLLLEKTMRASLAELGSKVGVVNPPMSLKDVEEKNIHGSISLAWRIGRAVKIARQKAEIDLLPQRILESVNNTGALLFSGKIIDVERKLFKGHAWGEVVIEEVDNARRKMTIPFKNENIYCKTADADGSNEQIVCSVPDLIAVIDAATGEAVGTSDYRYGLLVFVLGIAPSNKWTDTERGIQIGGPAGFDLDFEYKPISTYSKPVSVIQEYAQ